MKLLFVGYFHGLGGAEKMLTMLANEMSDRGHDVFLVGMAEDNLGYPLHKGVKYSFCVENNTTKIGRIMSRFTGLKRRIAEIDPDLIIHFNFQSTYLCYFMGKKIQGKTIYAERTDPYDVAYKGALGILRKYVFKRIKGFVFQTQGARDFFDKETRQRSCIIHNPVFIEPETSCGGDREKRIVNVGRLHHQKNQCLLINAWSKIAKDYPDYRLEIYGSGVLENQLKEQIQELNLNDRVFLPGSFSDIHQRIKDAAVFVLSSDYEGMPNALMEAMALGIPCVSTDCRPGGARELIRNGINGVIVPCNDVEALSEAIKRMIDDPVLSEAMGMKARDILEKHSPKSIYDKWEQYFVSCIGGGGYEDKDQ